MEKDIPRWRGASEDEAEITGCGTLPLSAAAGSMHRRRHHQAGLTRAGSVFLIVLPLTLVLWRRIR